MRRICRALNLLEFDHTHLLPTLKHFGLHRRTNHRGLLPLRTTATTKHHVLLQIRTTPTTKPKGLLQIRTTATTKHKGLLQLRTTATMKHIGLHSRTTPTTKHLELLQLRTAPTTKHIGHLQLPLNHLSTSRGRIMKFKKIHILDRHVYITSSPIVHSKQILRGMQTCS